MRYLALGEVLEIYRRVMLQSGGLTGIRDMGALASSVAQPRMVFAGQDLYRGIPEKASALGFSLIQNHPFIDGNKRTGHAAMETFLMLNGFQIRAGVDEQIEVVLAVASSSMSREDFTGWLRNQIIPLQ